jgi:putative phosphoribosyl transferase
MSTRWVFRNRDDAGLRLASELSARGYPKGPTIVLGIPNGGMVVAAQVARALGAELDLISVRRILHPHWPKASLGAVAADGTVLLNDLLIAEWGLDNETLGKAVRQAYREAQRRAAYFRGSRPTPVLSGKSVVLVDDTMISGYSMMVAAQSAQAQGAQEVVIAVPTLSVQAGWRAQALADSCICLTRPYPTVREAYRDYEPVPDEVVLRLLLQPQAVSKTVLA